MLKMYARWAGGLRDTSAMRAAVGFLHQSVNLVYGGACLAHVVAHTVQKGHVSCAARVGVTASGSNRRAPAEALPGV